MNKQLTIPEKLQKEGRGNYWVQYKGVWFPAEVSWDEFPKTLYVWMPGIQGAPAEEIPITELGEEIICPYNQ